MRCTLTELAALDGMPSEPTLRKLIAADPDFPVLKRGSNGDAYEFDVAAAVAYVVDQRERERDEQRRRGEDLRQFALGLGLGGAEPATQGLSIADRKALLEEELVAIKVAKSRGELVSKASVEAALSTVMVWWQQTGSSFAARLAKRVDLSREMQIEIEALMRADQAALAGRMEALVEIGAGDDGEPAADDTGTALEHPAA